MAAVLSAETQDVVMASTLSAEKQDALVRQLEYYLADVSLPYDTFLAGEMKRDDSDCTVSIAAETLASFPRVAQLAPDASESERAAELRLAAAKSDSLRVCADGRIGRRFPLPADHPSADRSVHLDGFGKSISEETVRSVITGVGETAGKIRRLRDLKDRSMSGACHVEFESAASAEAVIKASVNGKLVQPTGRKVSAVLLRAHFEAEAADVVERRKKIEAKQAKKKEAAAATLASAKADALRHAFKEHGRVLKFESWAGIKAELLALCSAHGEVAYADEGVQGYVRFKSRDAATAALAAFTSVAGTKTTTPTTGEAAPAATTEDAAPATATAPGEAAAPATGEAPSAGEKRARDEAGALADEDAPAAKKPAVDGVGADAGVAPEAGASVASASDGAASSAVAADADGATSAMQTDGGTLWTLLTDAEVDAYWTDLQLRIAGQRAAAASALGGTGYLLAAQEHGIVLGFDGVGAEAQREDLKALAGKWGEVHTAAV